MHQHHRGAPSRAAHRQPCPVVRECSTAAGQRSVLPSRPARSQSCGASATSGSAIESAVAGPSRQQYRFPPPTLEAVVVPGDPDGAARLRLALAQLAEQDPLIDVRADETGRELSAPVAERRGFNVFFKAGWRKGLTHQAALLERDGRRVALAVLAGDAPTRYGQSTLAGIASRVLNPP